MEEVIETAEHLGLDIKYRRDSPIPPLAVWNPAAQAFEDQVEKGMRKLRIFDDGSYILADAGNIDGWRMSIHDGKGNRLRTPTDEYCFSYFLSIGDNLAVWRSLVQMARGITKDERTVSMVELPKFTGTIEEQRVFGAFAAMLVAEENRVFRGAGRLIPTKVGKRIKLVGAYQVLIEGMSPREAADWSKGLKAHVINAKYDEIPPDLLHHS